MLLYRAQSKVGIDFEGGWTTRARCHVEGHAVATRAAWQRACRLAERGAVFLCLLGDYGQREAGAGGSGRVTLPGNGHRSPNRVAGLRCAWTIGR